MKKLFMKSLLGVPLTIFFYEIINIILSIAYFENQYFRLDMFNFTEILITYAELAIVGYTLCFSLYYEKHLRNSGKAEHEIAKKYVKVLVSIFTLMAFIIYMMSCIYPDFYAVAISSPIILLIYCAITAVKGICDGNAIKKINKKIKENQNKEN